MTVVPRSTELSSKERILSGLTRRNRALGKTTNTVRTDAVELSDTVPMEAATIVLERVLNVNNNLVSPVGSDHWPGLLAVDEEALNGSVAIWITCCICNLKAVSNSLSSGGMFLIKVCLDAVTTAPASTRVGTVGASSISH